MLSKTPKFDAALGEYFSKLELDERGGQWRVCRFSGEKFYVRPEDIAFYKKMRVPLPTLSPNERWRLMLSFINSYYLFYIKSALTGERIISQYPPDNPYKVYEHTRWFGGDWNPEDYGRDYDLSTSFFEQFEKLMKDVPRPSLNMGGSTANSDYTNDSVHLKNCYLVFNSFESENCHYTISAIRSRDSIDCFDIFDSSLCYECFESHELYNCKYVEFSKNCLDSYFLYDCKNCTNCFGGINLRNKKYIFFGEQLTKEEYEKKIAGINLGNRNILESYVEKFQQITKQAIHKPNHNEKSSDSYGEYIQNSTKCFGCLFAFKTERSAYTIGTEGVRDSYDTNGVDVEYSYFSMGSLSGYKNLFSNNSRECRDIEYSDLCGNCHDVFGCVGLLNKSFCIFNKQYTEKEYWEKVDTIKTKMLADEEYGEFFPSSLSPFPYNISLATSYKGFDDLEVAKKYGYFFQDIKETRESEQYDIRAEDVPIDIKNTDDDVLKKVIFDPNSSKKFQYTKTELEFHKKHEIALPIEHFTARLKRKRDKFGSIALKFFNRICPRCGIDFETVYRPDDPCIVYCEKCYLKEIV